MTGFAPLCAEQARDGDGDDRALRRPEAREVTVNALHPARCSTRKWSARASAARRPGRDRHPLRSSRRDSAALDGVTGQYFDRTQPGPCRGASYDDTARRRLWQISERLVGIAGDGLIRNRHGSC